MSHRRLLAVLALLSGLIAALLLFLELRLPRGGESFTDWLRIIGLDVVLGLIALVGSVLIYDGRYQAGGIINLIMGAAIIILTSTTAGLFLAFSGILGLVAGATHEPYYPET